MAVEIEHKYLVNKELWYKVQPRKGEHIRQGYIVNEPEKTVRVRTIRQRAFITVKGKSEGASRDEYEFRIPLKEANEMLDRFCGNVIEKTRYKVRYRRRTWEVDVFEGPNEGLIVAEIELQSEDQKYKIPAWVEQEVTGDLKYYNSNLSERPYSVWGD
jgi:CYTH domain-containing protein